MLMLHCVRGRSKKKKKQPYFSGKLIMKSTHLIALFTLSNLLFIHVLSINIFHLHTFETIAENADLLTDTIHLGKDLFVAANKAINGVFKSCLLAKFKNILLCLSKIVSRHSWIHVVNCLVL